MKGKQLIKDEKGSVMVIALILLTLLTLMGISASTTSTIEVQIAGNDRIYKQNFYSAESLTMRAGQLAMNTDLTTNPGWIVGNTTNLNDLTNWTPIGTRSYIVAVYEGVADGSSMTMGKGNTLHQYAIHGQFNNTTNLSDATQGTQVAHVEMGFKKRF